MLRQTIIFLILLLCACDNKQNQQVKFGCDPPCKNNEWLSFSYDNAFLFHDTSGNIKKTLSEKNLDVYFKTHQGKRLTTEAVNDINDALSCRLWTCSKTPVKSALYNPENIIVFIKSGKPVAHIATCSKSNIVDCIPDSENKEISTIDAIIFTATSFK